MIAECKCETARNVRPWRVPTKVLILFHNFTLQWLAIAANILPSTRSIFYALANGCRGYQRGESSEPIYTLY